MGINILKEEQDGRALNLKTIYFEENYTLSGDSNKFLVEKTSFNREHVIIEFSFPSDSEVNKAIENDFEVYVYSGYKDKSELMHRSVLKLEDFDTSEGNERWQRFVGEFPTDLITIRLYNNGTESIDIDDIYIGGF